jgi:phage-related protein
MKLFCCPTRTFVAQIIELIFSAMHAIISKLKKVIKLA